MYAIEGTLRGLDGKRLPVRLKIELKERAADALSKDRKPRDFSLVGSTIIDAHMQAIGLVSDHLIDCFLYKALRGHK